MQDFISLLDRVIELLGIVPVPVWIGAGLIALQSANIVFGTHWLKRKLIPKKYRGPWRIRIVFGVLWSVPTVYAWPGDQMIGAFVSLAVTMFWMFAYDAFMSRLYAKYPELIEKHSAQPDRGCY